MNERFETFTVLMTKISRNIRKIKAGVMSEFDLKSAHVSCVYYLYKSGPLTATELCEACEEDKAAVSRSIDYLEKNGYIVCDSETAKRYKTPLRLTDKGNEIGRRLADRVDSVLDEVGAEMGDEMRKTMYESLSIVCEDLQTISQRYE